MYESLVLSDYLKLGRSPQAPQREPFAPEWGLARTSESPFSLFSRKMSSFTQQFPPLNARYIGTLPLMSAIVDYKTDFYYTIVILKNQGAYLMYSGIFLKEDSTHPLTNREKGVIIHTIFFKRYDREK